METQEIKTFNVVEQRSEIACMRTGFRMALDNIWQQMAYSWPSIVLTILCPLFYFLFAAQLDAIFQKWMELGYLPKVKPLTLRQLTTKRLTRSLLAMLLIVLCVLLGVGFAVLAAQLGAGVWMGVAVAFLMWLLLLPVDAVVMTLSYTDEPIKSALCRIPVGARHYGMLFSFHFVVTLCALLAIALFSLPLVAVGIAQYSAILSSAMGDEAVLPASFPLIRLSAYWISAFVVLQVVAICRTMHVLLWGSIAAKESENYETPIK